MQFYSTNHNSAPVSFREAVLKGMPDDRGLFMPEKIPYLGDNFFETLQDLTFKQIAYKASQSIIENEIPEDDLEEIVGNVFNFDIPIVNIHDNIHVLELFHGPTLAFKDFGARFMARVMGYFLEDENTQVNILVATSGDTGSAVAQGFFGVEGIKVTLLYPKNKVSKIQEQQLTTVGGNVQALEVDGTFDDCQKMVKTAFLDKSVTDKMVLSSANSINIARLLPQSFYYLYAVGQLMKIGNSINVCVPSGNFGNLCGGLVAKRFGLPIKQFVAATNANDVVPEYLLDGQYNARPSKRTISNAMDVGNPSNFARMLDLYDNDWPQMKNDILGVHYSDDETRETIKQVFNDHGYLLCPHSAIGYRATKEILKENSNDVGLFLSTAHPAKFTDVVQPLIGKEVQIPDRLSRIVNRKKEAVSIGHDYCDLKDYLLKNC